MDKMLEEVVQENIKCLNYEVSDDYIICPCCGYKEYVEYEMFFGDKQPDVYEEGEEELKCPHCGHTFRLTKEKYISYQTEVLEGR